MADIFLIRHPEAQRRIGEEHGPSYGLTAHGEDEAREVGSRLLEITDGDVPADFECATSKRSRDAAKLIAGVAGIPTPISEQDAFNRLGLSVEQIQANMFEWIFAKERNGIFVAVLSRAALATMLMNTFHWSMQEVLDASSEGRAAIPTGSVTHLVVHPWRKEINVDYYGLLPGVAAERAWRSSVK